MSNLGKIFGCVKACADFPAVAHAVTRPARPEGENMNLKKYYFCWIEWFLLIRNKIYK